jgi:DNA repair exonuclease SbcCD ATPase subunit
MNPTPTQAAPTAWLQIGLSLAAIVVPFLIAILVLIFKDRKQLKISEDQHVAAKQKDFMTALIESGKQVPTLLQEVRAQMTVIETLRNENHELKKQHDADISRLQGEIDALRKQLESLETDRDHWREQAQRVPGMEAIMAQQSATIEDMRTERDDLRKRVTDLETLLTAE